MADYAKLMVGFVSSPNSDYSDPVIKPKIDNYTSSPTNVICQKYNCKITSNTTIELGTFSATAGNIHYLIVKNLDTTNFVSVNYTTKVGGVVVAPSTTGHNLAAGKIAVFPDVDVSADLVLRADTADVDVLIIIVGLAVEA